MKRKMHHSIALVGRSPTRRKVTSKHFLWVALLLTFCRCIGGFSVERQLERNVPARPLASGGSLEECPKTLSSDPCYWKPTWTYSRWQRRIHVDDLKVGQKLVGYVVEELLDAKTGPKAFFEVGVGRTDAKGRWKIVHGMLRLGRAKESVTNKRAARLRKKESVDLWVSRVQSECGRLEVCLDEEDVKKFQGEQKVRVSSLKQGQEVVGNVVRLQPYGAVVDVGANRLGLLHILKVRSLYGRFIDGEKGLIDAGIERGARVRLAVESIEKRRLSLDFTEDVKKEAEEEHAKNQSTAEQDDTVATLEEGGGMSTDGLEEWASFATIGDTSDVNKSAEKNEPNAQTDFDEEEEEEDDHDDYDEERDIEDSLGLGYY